MVMNWVDESIFFPNQPKKREQFIVGRNHTTQEAMDPNRPRERPLWRGIMNELAIGLSDSAQDAPGTVNGVFHGPDKWLGCRPDVGRGLCGHHDARADD